MKWLMLLIASSHALPNWEITDNLTVSKLPLDILEEDKKYSNFVRALKKFPELISRLKSNQPMTIFAPTNDSFEEEWSDDFLKKILQYHLIDMEVKQYEFQEGMMLPTYLKPDGLKGRPQFVKVWEKEGQIVIGNEYQQVKVDLEGQKRFTNGAIYPTTKMMIFPSNLADQGLLTSTPYSIVTFYAAIYHTGLATILRDMEGITVMAPSDDAFAALGESVNKFLFSAMGRPFLAKLLLYHIIRAQPYPIYTTDIGTKSTSYETMLMEKKVSLQKRAGVGGTVVVVNDHAHVSYPNLLGSNGVIHILDRVLCPFQFPTGYE